MKPSESLAAIHERERQNQAILTASIVKDFVSLVVIVAFLFALFMWLPEFVTEIPNV